MYITKAPVKSANGPPINLSPLAVSVFTNIKPYKVPNSCLTHPQTTGTHVLILYPNKDIIYSRHKINSALFIQWIVYVGEKIKESFLNKSQLNFIKFFHNSDTECHFQKVIFNETYKSHLKFNFFVLYISMLYNFT